MTAASMPDVVQFLVAQLAAFQAALLIASGVHKWLHRGRTQTVVREFARVPRRIAPVAVVLIAGAELLTGVLLLIPACRAAASVLAAMIWCAYLLLILRAIGRGRREVDCGCTFGSAHRPLGVYQVARNAGLVCMALLVAGASATGDATALFASQVLAAIALLVLYGALDQTMALMPGAGGAR
jgi:uncharacterized membrane protein YphA (DoxX/SURF4 family)